MLLVLEAFSMPITGHITEENRGTVSKTIDAIIATYCIENKLPLLHSDKDFQPFHEHLKLKNAVAGT